MFRVQSSLYLVVNENHQSSTNKMGLEFSFPGKKKSSSLLRLPKGQLIDSY